eukprot:15355099-Ditylum_brightwellii.AAC.1
MGELPRLVQKVVTEKQHVDGQLLEFIKAKIGDDSYYCPHYCTCLKNEVNAIVQYNSCNSPGNDQCCTTAGGRGSMTLSGLLTSAPTALQKGSSNTLATSVRLSQLAGLICAECMPLWRATMFPDDDDNLYTADWIKKHPMFDGWNDIFEDDNDALYEQYSYTDLKKAVVLQNTRIFHDSTAVRGNP